MKIIITGSFKRDIGKISNRKIRSALYEKIQQIEHAENIQQVTGLKLLEGYSHHYRIKIKSEKYSYRIGAIIRGEIIWLVRFLPRRVAYKKFP